MQDNLFYKGNQPVAPQAVNLETKWSNPKSNPYTRGLPDKII